MNQLLGEAFEGASKLPEEEQERLARLLLEEMEPNRKWDELFATRESETFLARMVDETDSERRAGLTKPLSIGDL